MSEYERSQPRRTGEPGRSRDGTLNLPESGNRVPDILDEARWELEFLLSMQVPAGKPYAGMVHHKIHDDAWTGLPLLPAPRPASSASCTRPSTAATLNLAATAAQAARVFRPYDRRVRRPRTWRAAQTAWAAAQGQPGDLRRPGRRHRRRRVQRRRRQRRVLLGRRRAVPHHRRAGEYRGRVLASPHHTGDIWRDRGFDWGNTAQLGRLDLATLPSPLPDRDRVRASVVAGRRPLPGHARGPPVRRAVRAGRQPVRLGLQQPGPQQRGRAGRRLRPHRPGPVPRRRAGDAWTTCSAATRSTSPT